MKPSRNADEDIFHHPLVNLSVDRSWGGGAKETDNIAFPRCPVASMWFLRGKLQVFAEHRLSIRFGERERLAFFVELEVVVQWEILLIYAGGEYDEVTLSRKRDRWETPLEEIVRIVAERVPLQVAWGRIGVVDLDPVGTVKVLILQAAFIDRHEFRNDERRSYRWCKQKSQGQEALGDPTLTLSHDWALSNGGSGFARAICFVACWWTP